MECYSAIKKRQNATICTTWIYLENIMLSEITQSGKAKNHDFTHMWYIKLKIIVTDNSMVVTRVKGAKYVVTEDDFGW